MLAEKLHQIMAEEDDPASTPETYHLPEAVHTRFREKVFLYREANILLAPDHGLLLLPRSIVAATQTLIPFRLRAGPPPP